MFRRRDHAQCMVSTLDTISYARETSSGSNGKHGIIDGNGMESNAEKRLCGQRLVLAFVLL